MKVATFGFSGAVVALRSLSVNSVIAGAFEDRLVEARTAKARNDIAGAQRALQAAQLELGRLGAATVPAAKAPVAPAPATKVAGGDSGAQEAEMPVFERLSNRGVRFQLGPGLTGGDAGPAIFAFARNINEGTSTRFNANFTLGYSPNLVREQVVDPLTHKAVTTVRHGAHELFGDENTTWVWDSSIQGQLTGQDNNQANAWTFRLGGAIDHTNPALMSMIRARRHLFERALATHPDDPVAEVRRLEAQGNGSPDLPFYFRTEERVVMGRRYRLLSCPKWIGIQLSQRRIQIRFHQVPRIRLNLYQRGGATGLPARGELRRRLHGTILAESIDGEIVRRSAARAEYGVVLGNAREELGPFSRRSGPGGWRIVTEVSVAYELHQCPSHDAFG